MTEETISCVEPVEENVPETVEEAGGEPVVKERKMDIARVGAKAPEFQGMAYYAGGFKQVKLSDYEGKWTVLCFYPGDFTFV